MSENGVLVSVVVPVYNVEQYVSQCISSILNQVYKNMEIIIVNDGSTDSSELIIREFTIDPRIRYFSKENGGLSDARNFGIHKSTGEYICFIDSDDYIHPNYIYDMLYEMKHKNLDIVECDFIRTENRNYQWKKYKDKYVENVYSGVEYMHNLIGYPVAWNKLYKSAAFKNNNIYYPLGKYNEDEGTTYKLYYYANRVGFLNKKLYVYFINEKGIMRQYTLKRLDYILLMQEKAEFFKNCNDSFLYKLALKQEINGILLNYYKVKKYLNNYMIANSLYSSYKKKIKFVLCNCNIRYISKLIMIICFIFPSFYGFIQIRLLKKGE